MIRSGLSDSGFRIEPVPRGVRRFAIGLLACFLLLSGLPVLAEENVVSLSGDTWHWYSDDKLKISGNVTATYHGFKITADSVEADLQTNMAVFEGAVKLTTQDHAVDGKHLVLNLKTRDWQVQEAGTEVALTSAEGKPSGKAFVRSAEVSGDEKDLSVRGGSFTTCDLEHPHYMFRASRIDIFPDKRIVARGASMIGLDHKLFSLGTVVIPIHGLTHNFIPQVGSTAEEGTFLKTSYAYTATDRNQGYLKLDLMEKRGIGTGVDHSYSFGSGTGQASLYFLADREVGGNNLTGRVQHQQKLGALNLNLTGDYRTNNYLYYPSSTSRNWQAALSRATGKSSTSLSFRNSGTSGFGTSDTSNTSLRHTQQFSSRMTGLFSMDMRSYSSSGLSATDRELDSSMELRHREEKYDLALLASKRNDLDGSRYTGDDYYGSLDRLPELSISTDSYRWKKNPIFGLPFRLSMSAGKYHEMPGDVTSNRLLFQWDMLSKPVDLGDRNDLNLTAGYRQAYYASDSMQYVLKLGAALTTRYGDSMKTRLTYNMQDVDGFSPFHFDYTSMYNYLRLATDYQDSSKMRWTLSTGYDFRRPENRWQDVVFRLTANPNRSYGYSVATGYDLNRSKWRSLVTQIRLFDPNRISMNLGTRYDVETGKVGIARGKIDWRVNEDWRLEGITSWSGATRAFDYRSFRVTRDLHCWEVSLGYNDETGFRNDRGISLTFNVKAFKPVDRFGIGQYGQTVDTSLGEYFY